MRVKIEMEMGGNELIDLLRKTPKAIATRLLNSTLAIAGSGTPDERDLLFESARTIIESKKR